MAKLSDCLKIHFPDEEDGFIRDMIKAQVRIISGGTNRSYSSISIKAAENVIKEISSESANINAQLAKWNMGAEAIHEDSNIETLPDGSTVNWDKVETKEKDDLKGTYYATYNKNGTFKRWNTKTEIERIKNLKGAEGLNLKQDNYGSQTPVKSEPTKGKQAGLGLVVEDPNQPGMFGEKRAEYEADIARKYDLISKIPAIKIADKPVSREEALEFYRQAKSVLNKNDNREIFLPFAAFKKIARHNGKEIIFQSFSKLKDLLTTAEPIYFEAERYPEKHNNIVGYHNYLSKAEIGDNNYWLRFTVQSVKKADGNELHNVAVSDVQITRAESGDYLSGISKPTIDRQSSLVDHRLMQWLKDVKSVQETGSNFIKEAVKTYTFDEQLSLFNLAKGHKMAQGKYANQSKEIAKEIEQNRLTRTKTSQTVGESLAKYKSAVAREFGERKLIDYTGRQISMSDPAQDLADLFYVYRSPKKETLHAIYTDKDGVILSHNAISSGALDYVSAGDNNKHIYKIQNTANRLGADKVHILHNHPSGDPTMSQGDVNIFYAMKKDSPKIGQFIVINGNTFTRAELMSDGKISVTQSGYSLNKRSLAANESRADWLTSKTIVDDAESVAGFGKSLAWNKDQCILVYANTKLGIQGFSAHNKNILTKPLNELKKTISQQSRAHDAISAFVLLDDADLHLDLWNKIKNSKEPVGDWLTDVVNKNGEGIHRHMRDKFERVGEQKKAVSLFEERAEYEDRKSERATAAETQARDEAPQSEKTIAAMQIPELVQIYKEVSGGKYPKIKEIIGRLATRQGVFKHPSGDIQLKADIFKNENEALKVLAHEVGHWIDWIPDKDLRRGNILGRIASLKGYMDHWLDDILGGPGRITEADKRYFKAEAKKLLGGERWIDEIIEKTIPITPDEVLDIWNAAIPGEAHNPELLDIIMRADTAQKKAIAVAAMRGLVADEIKHIGRIVREATGKRIKVKIEPNDKELMDKYRELIKEQIKKRNIYNLEEIREELKDFTRQWNPFDPSADPKYTIYRYSGKELYADAMSGLLTDPDGFRAACPRFWSAWFSWIHRKPEFKAVWDIWQNKINVGSVNLTKERMKNIYEMFESNDKARADEYMKQREGAVVSAYDGLMTYFWDKHHKALELLRKLEKEPEWRGEHAKNTRYLIEEANYISSEVAVYLGDVFEHIINPLESMGYDAKELGLVLFQKRVLGDRSKIGNPLGHSPETTSVDVKNIEETIWGAKKSKAISDFADKLRSVRESLILPLVEQSGLATPEFMQVIKDTKSYATFSNVEWFKNKYGSGPGAGFYRQIGTLGEIENPVISMILKDISLVRAARMNITKRELSVDLFHAGAIEQAKMRYSKDVNGHVPVEPPDPKKALYSFLVNGKPEYYYVGKQIADMFKYAPVEAQQVATIWRYLSQPVREILVSKNPVWMVRNVFRDVRQTIKNVPEVSLKDIPRLLIEYKRAFNEARKEVFGKERSPAIRQMLSDKALPTNRMWNAFDEPVETELDRMGMELNLSRKQNLDSPTARKALKFVWDNLDKIGRLSEVWGKLAGYKYLKRRSARSDKEVAHVVRTRIGTPDYRRTGTGQQITNNIFLFSNVGKEGIRAAIESATENPGGYAWKTLWTNVMPKLIIGAIGAGYVTLAFTHDEDEPEAGDVKQIKMLQRCVEGISEYDRANYTIIPLGLTDIGESVYLRIPEDYEGQFWGAVAHKLLHGKIAGSRGVVNLTKDQIPYTKFHPIINAITTLITYYVKGQNPVDDYSGRNVISDTAFEAGGADAHKAMAKSTWKELGGKVIYEPAWDGLERDEGVWRKALKSFPLNALGTFLKVSDQGITEKLEAEIQTVRKEKAKVTLKTNEAFIQLVNGEKITPEQALLIIGTPEHEKREKLLSLIGRKYGNAHVKQLTRPDLSNDEEIAVINMMLKDNSIGKRELGEQKDD